MVSYALWNAAVRCKNGIRKFFSKEDGDVNVVSIVVLIGIAVLLAILFKDRISALLSKLFTAIDDNATKTVTEAAG